jgi:flagellar basal body-associated protein FliL
MCLYTANSNKQMPSKRYSKPKYVIVGLLIIVLVVIASVVLYTVIPGSQEIQSVHRSYPNDDTDLVIAFCREDLTWVFTVARQFRRVYIYTKCGGCVENTTLLHELQTTHTNIRIIPLPNIGSCDYVYLTHIIEEYHTLPTAIEFHVGTGNRSSRRMRYYFNYLGLWGFSLHKYTFTNHVHMPFKRSVYNNLWHYSTVVLGTELTSRLWKRTQYIYMGGVFMATRDEIQKHPRKVYEQLRHTQHHPNEEVDHFIERLWGPLFTCA